MKNVIVLSLFLCTICFAEGLNLYNKGFYFYEKTDVEWHINFRAKIPSFCGIYFILFNTQGKTLYCGAIPYADYSEKPYTITIPQDNLTGYYKGVIVGEEAVFDALQLPLSDLEYEVYGGNYFATHYKGKLYFQVNKDDTLVLAAYKGHLKVLNEKGDVIADTRQIKKQEKYDNLTEFQAHKGTTYVLEKDSRYFRVKGNGKIFISNDARKLFVPEETIDSVEWWKLPLSTKETR